jgi:hypothetical protein
MAPEYRVVSVLGLRVVGGSSARSSARSSICPCLLCCRPNLIAVVVVTEIRSSISSQAPQISKFSFFCRSVYLHACFICGQTCIDRQSKDRDQKKRDGIFLSFYLSVGRVFSSSSSSFLGSRAVVAVSTTRTSQRVKDFIQLRDSINTLSLWIRSSLTDGIRDFPL